MRGEGGSALYYLRLCGIISNVQSRSFKTLLADKPAVLSLAKNSLGSVTRRMLMHNGFIQETRSVNAVSTKAFPLSNRHFKESNPFPTTIAQHVPVDATHTLYSETLNNLTDMHQTTPTYLSKPSPPNAEAALHALMQLIRNPGIAVSRSRHPSAMVPRLVPEQLPPLPVLALQARLEGSVVPATLYTEWEDGSMVTSPKIRRECLCIWWD